MSTTHRSSIVALDRLASADAGRAGAKACNCARLKQAGFRVPDGLVLLSTATDEDLAALADHPWFDALPDDARFAVRSSGIGEDGEGESFAGIHQTMLDVRREQVASAVAACRASGRSTTALEYRRAKGIATDAIAMGVLIQRMVRPVTAGVAFTINPVTGDRNEMVINASWGLGEALVSGQVDPDEFVVRKATGDLVWSRIGEKAIVDAQAIERDAADASSAASLTRDQVRELAGVLTRIEREYGTPQDVEWCHDGSGFWIVQSRPVTTGRANANEIEWTRANVAEVMPDITSPQALASFEETLNRAEQRFLGGLLAPEHELGPIVKSFCGRLHFNLSQLRRVCRLGGVAPATMLRSIGHGAAIDPADETPPKPSMDQMRHLPDLLRMVWRHLRASAIIRQHRERMHAVLTRLAAHDPHQLSDAALWTIAEEWSAQAPDSMEPVLLLSNVTFHEVPLQKICARVGVSFEALVYPQLAIGACSVSAQQAFDLVALADVARREPEAVRFLSGDQDQLRDVRVALRGTQFVAALERFLGTYGHRGRYEYDWSLPRYHEDPTPLLLAVRAHLDSATTASTSADTLRARREDEAARAWTMFEQQLSRWQRWTLPGRVRRSIAKIKQYYVWREQVRSDLVRVVDALRAWHLVLADRFVARGWLDRRDDYFLLYLSEVASAVRDASRSEAATRLRSIVAARAAELARYRMMQMPLLMRESELPALIRQAGVSGAATEEGDLHGQAVSGGCVEADVVVVRDPGDFGRMKRGAILVAPATDPSWTPLFTLASGVIVEVGGVLSHASTIAREYGLPAVANIRHATRRLKTGDRVRLDATHGLVQRLQPAAIGGERS